MAHDHRNAGISYYSGQVVYRTTFKIDDNPVSKPLAMELVRVKDVGIQLVCFAISFGAASAGTLEDSFKDPPDSARPGVYWYFMDGNLDREEMVKDLESMKEAGLGNLVFLEVNVGVPRGLVNFMSDPWQELFVNAVRHAERLGIDITLGAGPGWTGSGGPWVKPEQSMQHLVFSTVETQGPRTFDGVLPIARRQRVHDRPLYVYYRKRLGQTPAIGRDRTSDITG